DASGTMNVRNGAIGVKDNTIGPTQLDETASYTFSGVLAFSSSGTVDIPDSTVAGLGTATTGYVRRLSDGGAVGSPVLADGTQFECPEENTQKIRIATCPPWNVTADGTTDDRTALQAMLTSGATVYLPAGTYIIGSDAWRLNVSNLTVRGAGIGQTILKMKDSTNLDRVVLFQNCTNCLLQDVTVDQNNANQSSGSRRAVETATANTNVTLDRVELKGSVGINTFYGGGTLTGLTIRNSRIVGGGVAGRLINVASGTRVRITDNVVTAAGEAIGCASCVDATITGNTVDQTADVGGSSIFCSACTGAVMSNNNINSHGTTFVGGDQIGCFGGSTDIVLANNRVLDGTDNGVQVDDCSDVTVTGNVIDGALTNGISVLNSEGVTVVGNYVRDVGGGTISNNRNGIMLRSSAAAGAVKNVTVIGNVIVDLQGSPTMEYGIWDQGLESQQVTIAANEVRGATIASVDLGDSTSVGPNYVSNVAASTAIDVTGTAADGWTATVAWDATEVNDTTWGDNSDATITHTFNVSTGTDPVVSVTDNVWSVSTGKVGIGTTTVPHGGIGTAKVAIEGTNANEAGPHLQVTTSADDYPLMQWVNWQHDSVQILFDAHFVASAGVYRSSDAGSNYRLIKSSDAFALEADFGISAASTVTFDSVLLASSAGLTFNEGGLSAFDLRVEGDTDANLLTVDASGDKVGIGIAVPAAKLNVTTSALQTEVARFESVATNDDPSMRVFNSRGATSGAASATADIATASDKVYGVEFRTVARCVSGAGCTAGQGGYWVTRANYKNVGGVLSEITETNDFASDDITGTITNPAVSVSGTNIRLTVTGLANQELTWHTTWLIQEVGT
ncbi:MAG: right-handed parallel beta-helix repeat-containing protein, partial [Pirellulales bacterium]